MKIQSYQTVKECYAALINLGCIISPSIVKSFIDNSLYIFNDNCIMLDEFNLLN